MEFTLLDNGIDSLQKTKMAIDKINQLHYEFAGHHSKDAVVFLHHGTGILLKKYLSNINESLIFLFQKDYLNAEKHIINNHIKQTEFGYFGKYKQNEISITSERKI